MQDVVNELINIDADARKLTDTALAKRRNAGQIIAGRLSALREKAMAEADRSCAEFEKSARASAETSIAELREKNRNAIYKMESEYAAHGHEWAKKLFDGIISPNGN